MLKGLFFRVLGVMKLTRRFYTAETPHQAIPIESNAGVRRDIHTSFRGNVFKPPLSIQVWRELSNILIPYNRYLDVLTW
jgi:hypothetical protein